MYKRILIVVGSGPTHRAAVTEGVELAKVDGAEAVFFSVLPRYVMPVTEMPMIGLPSPAEFHREATANTQRVLAAAAVVADKAGVTSKTAVGAGADDADCIIETAKKKRCGLIVVASAGRNAVMRILSGSVIPGLITRSTIPVLIVRQQEPKAGAKRESVAPRRQRRLGRSLHARFRLAVAWPLDPGCAQARSRTPFGCRGLLGASGPVGTGGAGKLRYAEAASPHRSGGSGGSQVSHCAGRHAR